MSLVAKDEASQGGGGEVARGRRRGGPRRGAHRPEVAPRAARAAPTPVTMAEQAAREGESSRSNVSLLGLSVPSGNRCGGGERQKVALIPSWLRIRLVTLVHSDAFPPCPVRSLTRRRAVGHAEVMPSRGDSRVCFARHASVCGRLEQEVATVLPMTCGGVLPSSQPPPPWLFAHGWGVRRGHDTWHGMPRHAKASVCI